MNKGLLALNIVLLLAVGILYLLFFTKKDRAGETDIRRPGFDSSKVGMCTPVAYFEMDSIEANFTGFKKMQDEVLKKEQIKNDSINMLRMGFQNHVQSVQPLFQKMTLAQRDSLNSAVMELDNQIKYKIGLLNQEYQTYYFARQQEIVTQIKNYCKEFNKDGRYSYIIANEPLFYYADTAYNITSELLKGLNAYYSKKAKN
jgi:outer membrane protein